MCGRYILSLNASELRQIYQAEFPDEYRPSFNIAPSQQVPIVRNINGKNSISLVRWGLVPFWAKKVNTGYSTINAKAETIAEKPMFKNAFKHRRCLLPCSGFYEWQPAESGQLKQPWFISLKNKKPCAFAGIWESWKSPEGDTLESCALIVTEAKGLLKSIHDRMPCLLTAQEWDNWLNPTLNDPKPLQKLLISFSEEKMQAWPVSTAVNSPKHNSEECIAPIGEPLASN